MADLRGWSIDRASRVLPTSTADARSFVDRQLREHDLGHRVGDVQLVASELVTNALVHAGTVEGLELELLADSIVVRVWDGSKVRPVVVAALDLDTGGRGMRIVDALAMEWGVIAGPDGGKCVWASFDIGAGPT